MAEGRGEYERRNLVSLAGLVWGKIKDVGTFIETGRVDGDSRVGQPAEISPEVAEYIAACDKAGRFLQPEEVYGTSTNSEATGTAGEAATDGP